MDNLVPRIPEIEIEGVMMRGETLAYMIQSIVRPDPRVWFRFERVEDNGQARITVYQKREE